MNCGDPGQECTQFAWLQIGDVPARGRRPCRSPGRPPLPPPHPSTLPLCSAPPRPAQWCFWPPPAERWALWLQTTVLYPHRPLTIGNSWHSLRGEPPHESFPWIAALTLREISHNGRLLVACAAYTIRTKRLPRDTETCVWRAI